MKILLLGKSGLLGSALHSVFSRDHSVTAPSHEECDVLNRESLQKTLRQQNFDLVINSTGYTKVDLAETEKDAAFALNVDAVENLTKLLSSTEIPLVHFSTDYVFDGQKKEGYREDDKPSPLSIYGESKFKSEEIIRKNLKHYFIIRTSWLFGPHGKNFVDTMLEASHKKTAARDLGPLKVVDDQRGAPTYTNDLAEALLPLLETKAYGVYHVVNSGECSWYEFAVEIFNQVGVPQKVAPISSQELGRPAKRPAHSHLINTKLPPLRSWQKALEAYISDKVITI